MINLETNVLQVYPIWLPNLDFRIGGSSGSVSAVKLDVFEVDNEDSKKACKVFVPQTSKNLKILVDNEDIYFEDF